MRLMDILEEVTFIESEQVLEEANLKSVKAKYVKKAPLIAKQLKARKGNVNWEGSKEVRKMRNKLASAFVSGNFKKAITLMKGADGYQAVAVLQALETAHGGRDKLIKKAGGKKKMFMAKMFAYSDSISGGDGGNVISGGSED